MSATPGRAREMPLVAHLLELRNRLMKAALAVLICLFPLMYYSNELFALFAKPLVKYLPAGSMLIATDVASQFFAPFKLALVAALLIAMPVVIYQIWAFIAPGLYKHEKSLTRPILVSAVLLFYTGIAFAYFLVFPVVFGFFATIQIEGVTYMPDISMYLDFALFMFIAFGISFEIPVIVLLLVKMGVVPVQKLKDWRPYMIVMAFVIAAILTPPDPVSQTMMALPMCLLYELGVFAARMLSKPKAEAGEESTAS
nr:twin-arginine translocase subunit TatC [Permianibacter fluminis]